MILPLLLPCVRTYPNHSSNVSMTTIDFKQLRLGEKLSTHLRFTNKVRDFVKERADLERDFAKRLETLVKRHAPRKPEETGAISSDNVVIEEWARFVFIFTFHISLNLVFAFNNSTQDAWLRIIDDTMEQSKLHANLADMLIFSVADKLKALSIRKEESRKKVFRWLCFQSEMKTLSNLGLMTL